MRHNDLRPFEDDAIKGQIAQRLAKYFFCGRWVSHRGDREHASLRGFQNNTKFSEPLANEAIETLLGLDVGGKVCGGPHFFCKKNSRFCYSSRLIIHLVALLGFIESHCFPNYLRIGAGRSVDQANFQRKFEFGSDVLICWGALKLGRKGRFNKNLIQ